MLKYASRTEPRQIGFRIYPLPRFGRTPAAVLVLEARCLAVEVDEVPFRSFCGTHVAPEIAVLLFDAWKDDLDRLGQVREFQHVLISVVGDTGTLHSAARKGK
jgi:hypothetical protein